MGGWVDEWKNKDVKKKKKKKKKTKTKRHRETGTDLGKAAHVTKRVDRDCSSHRALQVGVQRTAGDVFEPLRLPHASSEDGGQIDVED